MKQEKKVPFLPDNKIYSHVTCCHEKSAIFAFLVSQKLLHHESLNTEKSNSQHPTTLVLERRSCHDIGISAGNPHLTKHLESLVSEVPVLRVSL